MFRLILLCFMLVAAVGLLATVATANYQNSIQIFTPAIDSVAPEVPAVENVATDESLLRRQQLMYQNAATSIANNGRGVRLLCFSGDAPT